jgi:hypothetical protein
MPRFNILPLSLKVILVFLAGYLSSSAQTTFTASNGNWALASNWSNGVPSALVAATIKVGSICTVNVANAQCASLTLSGGNGETTLIISSGNSLTVSGATTINAPTNGNKTNAINVWGNFISSSLVLNTSNNNNRDCEFAMNGGTATINGNITMNGTASRNAINFLGGGTLKVTGTISGGTIVPGTGTVEFGNAGVQSIPAYAYNDVTISGSGTKSIGGNLTFADLILASGDLSIGGNSLIIDGTISGSGTITGSLSSNLTINAANSLLMTQTNSGTRSLNNLTYNGSGILSISNGLEIGGTLTVSAGTLASGGNLTMTSTASGDARIAQSAGSITGNVIVQKFIPAGSGRRWLHMGSPIQNFTWSQVIDDILISGPVAGGFDVNGSNYPSAYTYTESVAGNAGPNGWNYPSNVTNSTPNGLGLKLFFRGDRNPGRLNYNGPAPNAVTLDFVGIVNSGTQNMGVTYTNNGNSTWDGWNFVSNPYPSPIDWNAASGWTKTNISGTVYVWNAQSGTYATWNGASGTNGMSNGRIAMGQGFWVKATSASPSLVMTESVKTGIATTGFFKTNLGETQTLRISMVQDSLVWDDAVFNFNDTYTPEYVKESGDALKLFNTSLNLWSITKDNQDLVINNLSLPVAIDTILLGMKSNLGGIFTLSFSTDSLPSHLSLFLIDSYRNKTIDIRKEKTWKVLINVEPESYAIGRLKLVLINQKATVINAWTETNQTNKSVIVNWSSANEINTVRYELERSTNGVDFVGIATVDLNDTLILAAGNYFVTDKHPQVGTNYYRIKRISTTGVVIYSDTVSGKIIETNSTGINQLSKSAIQVYPMPVSNKATFVLPEQLSGDIKIELVSADGSVVASSSYTKTISGSEISLNTASFTAGYYILRISSATAVVVAKLIKQ